MFKGAQLCILVLALGIRSPHYTSEETETQRRKGHSAFSLSINHHCSTVLPNTTALCGWVGSVSEKLTLGKEGVLCLPLGHV